LQEQDRGKSEISSFSGRIWVFYRLRSPFPPRRVERNFDFPDAFEVICLTPATIQSGSVLTRRLNNGAKRNAHAKPDRIAQLAFTRATSIVDMGISLPIESSMINCQAG